LPLSGSGWNVRTLAPDGSAGPAKAVSEAYRLNPRNVVAWPACGQTRIAVTSRTSPRSICTNGALVAPAVDKDVENTPSVRFAWPGALPTFAVTGRNSAMLAQSWWSGNHCAGRLPAPAAVTVSQVSRSVDCRLRRFTPFSERISSQARKSLFSAGAPLRSTSKS